MANKHKFAEPMYQKIALDIAEKIVQGKFQIGQKVSGRSVLAGQYSVSPETIRRATFMLKDLNIVQIDAGSGITITSVENAVLLVERVKNISTLTDRKNEIETLLEQQKQQQENILLKINELLTQIEHYQSAAPILSYEIKITKDCRFLGKMISEINFWQNTSVTVIGIKRKGSIIISPGPYALFEENDIFIMVGREGSEESVRSYLYDTSL